MGGAGPSLTDWLQVFIGMALAVLTCFYVITTRRQLSAMEKALAETRRSNEATEKSNEIAERSLELGSRAWLVVNLKTVLQNGNFNGYNIEITNVGKIPATEVSVWYRFDIWKGNEIPDKISRDSRQIPETGFYIGAGMTYVITPHLGALWSKEASDQMKRGEWPVFYCEVEYRDRFDRPRKTVACFRYSEQPTVFDWKEWGFAPKHNRLE